MPEVLEKGSIIQSIVLKPFIADLGKRISHHIIVDVEFIADEVEVEKGTENGGDDSFC